MGPGTRRSPGLLAALGLIEARNMRVKVVPAVGGGEPLELEVAPTATIGAVKTKVCTIKRLPEDVTRLTYKGRVLKPTETLSEIGVTDGDRLVLLTRTGGAALFQ